MSYVSNYYVIDFQHIDDQRAFHSLADAVNGDVEGLKELTAELERLFRKAGWEGDGTICAFFVPPVFCNRGDTHCSTLYHVKQENNGTSFLAVPKGFRFELEQGMFVPRPADW